MKKNLGVSMTWLGHGTVLYRSAGGRAVLVDAWVDQNPACPEEAKKIDRIDVIAITHGHGDHLADCVSLAKKHAPEVVCNYEVSLYLVMKNVGKVHGINKGGAIELEGIRFTMVHAVHSSTIHDGTSFYPGGEAAGFVIEFENGTRVYHAGDTGIFGDMKLIGEIYRPSIAVLPIGDLFTMGPLEASHAARMIGARAILPIHHSTFPALTGKPAELRERLKDSPNIEVIELRPGETVE